MRFLITSAIPDLPKWVAIEMAKVEFARREALRRLSSTVQTPAPETCSSQPSTYIGRLVIFSLLVIMFIIRSCFAIKFQPPTCFFFFFFMS